MMGFSLKRNKQTLEQTAEMVNLSKVAGKKPMRARRKKTEVWV